MRFPELTDDEIFGVLLCGKKPQGGYTVSDYVEEWNRRCDAGMNYAVTVLPAKETERT